MKPNAHINLNVVLAIILLGLLARSHPSLASPICPEALNKTTSISHEIQNPYYNENVQKYVRGFIRPFVNSDLNVLDQVMAIINSGKVNTSDLTPTLSLSILHEVRRFIETSHSELLENRSERHEKRFENRIKEITDMIQANLPSHKREFASQLKILDIGAGDGHILAGVSAALKIEHRNSFALELAKYEDRVHDLRWIGYDKTGKIELHANSIDIGIIMMVFHHAPDAKALMQEAFRVTKPGGLFIVRETDASEHPVLGLNHQELVALNQILDNLLYIVFDRNSGVPMNLNYQAQRYWVQLAQSVGFEVKVHPTLQPRSPFQPVFLELRKPNSKASGPQT